MAAMNTIVNRSNTNRKLYYVRNIEIHQWVSDVLIDASTNINASAVGYYALTVSLNLIKRRQVPAISFYQE